MFNQRSLSLAAGILVLAGCGYAKAATITYVGSQTNADVTAYNSPYLSDGYELFATSPTGTGPNGSFKQNGFANAGNTLKSLPSYVGTLTAGAPATNYGSAAGYGFPTIDDPTSAAGGTVESGLQATYTAGPNDTGNVLNAPLTGTVPSVFYVSLLSINTNNANLGLSDGSASANVNISAAQSSVNTLYTFQVSGAASGDTLTEFATASADTSGGQHGGVTGEIDSGGVLFSSTIPAVPEPATVGIAGLGLGMLLLRRRRKLV